MAKRITVYHYRRDLDATRVCELACKHKVTFHESKFLYPQPDHNYQKWIVGLNYTSDGWGEVRVAYDYQGRRYESEPTWDGYGPWVCAETRGYSGDLKTYWPRPVLRMDAAFTLDGRLIV